MFQISTAVKALALNRIVDLIPAPKVDCLRYSQEDIKYRLCLCGERGTVIGDRSCLKRISELRFSG